ncbi:MAG: ABC transporter permease [Synergistales bacterium]|nr:ABC transporter permease [Synergistales bacterium]
MHSYWFRRITGAALVLVAVLALNFILFRLMPGDPVSTVMDPSFSAEAKAELRSSYGLDEPLPEQFLLYVRRMLRFDFGISFLSRKPVWEELATRIPNTLMLIAPALVLAAVLGIWLGVMAAFRRGGIVERLVLWAGAVSFSFPSFFVQLVLLLVFAHFWQLFPLRGSTSVPPPPPGSWAALLDTLHHMALPVLSLVLVGFGSWALYVRNLMVRVLGEDFLLLARAKGLSEGRILWRHAFRTAIPPIVTLVFLALPQLISGAVITETVFSLHGVGRFLLEAIMGHDYPAAAAAFYLLALVTILANLGADLLYGYTDPRIRQEKGGGR